MWDGIEKSVSRMTVWHNKACWVMTNSDLFVLLVWFDSVRPINNFSVMQGQVFLGWTSTKLGLMCLAQGHNAVTPVRLKPVAPQSGVKHSTTELLNSDSEGRIFLSHPSTNNGFFYIKYCVFYTKKCSQKFLNMLRCDII